MTRLSIRIDFEPSGSAFGPGMARLLELVAEKGSIRAAATAMDMSYRKAWLLIQEVQKTFDGAVVTATAGGASGGGARLTELGTALVRLYRKVETRAARAARPDLNALSRMVRSNAPRRRSRHVRPNRTD
jgi:molybdate transport system regulatory protein